MPQLPRSGVGVREFARLDGCSHTAVQNAVKSGRLKVSEDGTLDPALVGTPWRAGNYKIVRGGKPRAARRQVATERQPAPSPELPAAEPRYTWGDRCQEPGAQNQLGVLMTLSEFGSGLPALAVETAAVFGLPPDLGTAYFEALRAKVREQMDELLAEHEIPEDLCTGYYSGDGEPFLPVEDFRRPGETEDERWARIIPAASA